MQELINTNIIILSKFKYLYSESQSQPHQLDLFKLDTIIMARFIQNRPLIILLHGYTGHKDFSPNTEIRPGKILVQTKNKRLLICMDFVCV